MALSAAYRGGHDGRPGWWFHFGYDADQIAQLKTRVPARHRVWDAERKEWWVAEEWQRELPMIWPAFDAYLKQASMF